MKKQSGFSLIELLVVVTIIAILSAVGIAAFRNVTSDARDAKRKADIDAIVKVYESKYDLATGTYGAISGTDFVSGEVPKDPDGTYYVVNRDSDTNTKALVVCSNRIEKVSETYCKYSANGDVSALPTPAPYVASTPTQAPTSAPTASPTSAPTAPPTPAPTLAPDITSGLMAYWKMDDNVSGNNKSLTDSSGNGNSGTTYYGANSAGMDCTAVGRYGKSCSFDGVDDYVNISSYIAPFELTIAAWVKINNMPAQGPYLITGAGNTFELQLWGGGINKFILGVATKNNGWQAGMGYTQMPFQVTTGAWYHVVGTYTSGVTKIYIDGQERGTSASTTGNILSNGGTVNIGKRSVYFNGQIDEVRIYDHALTPEQIDYLYHFVP